MVDRLRQSVSQLEAPVCPNCRVEMSWYQSNLVSAEPAAIVHHFICGSCQRTERLEGEFKPGRATPDRLSAPRLTAHVTGLPRRPGRRRRAAADDSYFDFAAATLPSNCVLTVNSAIFLPMSLPASVENR